MKSRNHSITTGLSIILLSLLFAAVAQAQDPEVNSADPDIAEQGTVDLDVVIGGENFDSSAVVTFFQSGTEIPNGIQVKKTKVRGPKKIVATIDVEPDAFVGDWDIYIELSGSRGGKGAVLFRTAQKSSSGNNTVESLRVTFRNLAGDGFRSDALSHPAGSLLCSDPASAAAQYWAAAPDPGFVDQDCQGAKVLATSRPQLTGPVGLVFKTQIEPVRLPSNLPPGNRWLELDFSQGIDIDGVPSLCPDIDTIEYVHPETTQPEIVHLVPPVNPGCIDNLEGRFTAGLDIFNLALNQLIPEPKFQIRIPIVRQLNKKHREYGFDAAYGLIWDTFVVTDPGDGNYVTMACDDSLGVAGHTCRARLTRGGPNSASRYPDGPEVVGDYRLSFSVTVQRVFCNADGTGCVVPP